MRDLIEYENVVCICVCICTDRVIEFEYSLFLVFGVYLILFYFVVYVVDTEKMSETTSGWGWVVSGLLAKHTSQIYYTNLLSNILIY